MMEAVFGVSAFPTLSTEIHFSVVVPSVPTVNGAL